jgi:hypothetical protein
MYTQAESRALLAKDALQDTLDALRQKMAVQELEHAEAERRWRDELQSATRLGERRRREEAAEDKRREEAATAAEAEEERRDVERQEEERSKEAAAAAAAEVEEEAHLRPLVTLKVTPKATSHT